MAVNDKSSYIDFDASENLLLDLPSAEIDRLYEETFNEKEDKN